MLGVVIRFISYRLDAAQVGFEWIDCWANMGSSPTMPEGRREFSRRMEGEPSLDQTATLAQFRGGWLVGAEDFVTRLLERVEGRVKEHHGGRERAETELEKARSIISRGLATAAWDAKRLRVEAKSHPLKIRIARILRERTTMPLKWIADALATGSWTYLNHLLHRPNS